MPCSGSKRRGHPRPVLKVVAVAVAAAAAAAVAAVAVVGCLPAFARLVAVTAVLPLWQR